MKDDVNFYDSVQKIFLGYSNDRLQTLITENKKFAYYCSADTAFNIIKNKEIWLRKITCMNDYQEVYYGYKKVKELLLNSQLAGELNKFFSKKNIELTSETLYHEAIKYFNELKTGIYIACVTEHDKREDHIGRLSMWRAYGRGNGVAIILNPQFSDAEISSKGTRLVTSPVLYLSPDQTLDQEFKKILDRMNRYYDLISTWNKCEYINIFKFLIMVTIPSIKHYGFHEEVEWRYLLLKNRDAYGCSDTLEKNMVSINGIPQIIYKLKLNKELKVSDILDKIIIGPVKYPDAIYDSFYELLKTIGISSPDDYIIQSSIPLRI